jgi:Mg-chelatase subunit ChlD
MRILLIRNHDVGAASAIDLGIQTAQDRDIVLVIDHSGSMAGGLIRRTIQHSLELFDTQINDRDTLSLLTFNASVKTRFGLTPVGTHRQQLRATIERATDIGGQTACYDAIMASMDRFRGASAGESAGRRQFVICLTDGADNRSTSSWQMVKQRLQNERTTTLIIVGVGDLPNAGTLRELCAASKDGAFIHADGGERISDAFHEVSRLMAGPEVTIETY